MRPRLLTAAFAAVLTVTGTGHRWEGDDGGLSAREAAVGVWVTRTNLAIWRAEEHRQAAEAAAQAERATAQLQLAQPPAAPRSVWDDLAQCESGGNWSINTGNGFYGGLQFTLQSWRGVGGTGYPHQHSREEQIARGIALQRLQGWGAWPACSRRLGLR